MEEYKEEMFSCAGHSHSPVTGSLLVPCDRIPPSELELRFQQDPQVSFVIKAVSALAAAFRLVQLDHCASDVRASCLTELHGDLHEDILSNLRKLSFSSMVPASSSPSSSPIPVEGTQHHFTRNGRLVANKQLVYTIDHRSGLQAVSALS